MSAARPSLGTVDQFTIFIVDVLQYFVKRKKIEVILNFHNQ
jgi:hypothetical protein